MNVVAPRPLAAISAIALNTFREAVRDRVLYLLLAFALVLIGVSRLVSMLTVGEEEKIIKDIGLSAISIFGVLTATFVGVSLVFKEIERRTIYTVLARPVSRWQFVCGKFGGLFAVLLTNSVLMTAALFAVLFWRGESPWALLPAVLLIIVELAVITAFALLFSSLTNPILAALFTVAVYVTGHLVWGLTMIAERLGAGPASTLALAAARVLPNLARLDIKSEVVHGLPLAEGYFVHAALYGTGYTVLVLALACLAFSRKEFA